MFFVSFFVIAKLEFFIQVINCFYTNTYKQLVVVMATFAIHQSYHQVSKVIRQESVLGKFSWLRYQISNYKESLLSTLIVQLSEQNRHQEYSPKKPLISVMLVEKLSLACLNLALVLLIPVAELLSAHLMPSL